MIQKKYSHLKAQPVQYFDPSLIVPGWIGCSPAMKQMLASLVEAAPTRKSILITGESGTGKESAARFAHKLSGLQPWVVLSCPNTTAELVESQLFGHKRGAFTGALFDHAGFFEQADGGTLFLDEIGDLPLHLQPRLLRVLQEGQVQRIGGTEPQQVSVRVICATHRNLAQMVQDGTFREDLYHRLAFFHIEMPPLRDRGEDILRLARSYLESEGLVRQWSPDARHAMLTYPWPGNVRELQRVVYKAALRCSRVIELPTLLPLMEGLGGPPKSAPRGLAQELERQPLPCPPPQAVKVPRAGLTETQRRILDVLRLGGGLSAQALAHTLEISQSTALRCLRPLVDEGLVSRTGQARATVYALRPHPN